VSMRREPTADAANVTTLGPSHDVRIIGGVRDWYRVQLDDGRAGFVRARDLGGAWSSKASH
jgi:SH3-like domain-containing protein